jgi:hypothetical protein
LLKSGFDFCRTETINYDGFKLRRQQYRLNFSPCRGLVTAAASSEGAYSTHPLDQVKQKDPT